MRLIDEVFEFEARWPNFSGKYYVHLRVWREGLNSTVVPLISCLDEGLPISLVFAEEILPDLNRVLLEEIGVDVRQWYVLYQRDMGHGFFRGLIQKVELCKPQIRGFSSFASALDRWFGVAGKVASSDWSVAVGSLDVEKFEDLIKGKLESYDSSAYTREAVAHWKSTGSLFLVDYDPFDLREILSHLKVISATLFKQNEFPRHERLMVDCGCFLANKAQGINLNYSVRSSRDKICDATVRKYPKVDSRDGLVVQGLVRLQYPSYVNVGYLMRINEAINKILTAVEYPLKDSLLFVQKEVDYHLSRMVSWRAQEWGAIPVRLERSHPLVGYFLDCAKWSKYPIDEDKLGELESVFWPDELPIKFGISRSGIPVSFSTNSRVLSVLWPACLEFPDWDVPYETLGSGLRVPELYLESASEGFPLPVMLVINR
ncbi:hypothetical protein ABZ644_07770 [Nocardiopsis alba]|uniref:hypothetical protein n=1 Tax=Nocardiopsis alba TaxID=53437 RepID=UPI0033CAAAEE